MTWYSLKNTYVMPFLNAKKSSSKKIKVISIFFYEAFLGNITNDRQFIKKLHSNFYKYKIHHYHQNTTINVTNHFNIVMICNLLITYKRIYLWYLNHCRKRKEVSTCKLKHSQSEKT